MQKHTPSGRPGTRLALTLLLCSATGCSHKHTGAPVVSSSGRLVDASWITATNACWPDLAKQGFTADQIRHNLADADVFHHAFPVYAAQNRQDLDDILGKPLQTGPDPDVSQLAHSQYPILTRGQAAAGTVAQMAVVQQTNGSAPPDSFCAIQPGIPPGFSK